MTNGKPKPVNMSETSMGICWCKCNDTPSESYAPTAERTAPSSAIHEHSSPAEPQATTVRPAINIPVKLIDHLVLKTLQSIPIFLDNDGEPPESIVKLRVIADNEIGWLMVISSIINVTPLEHPFGPSVITILLDDCPLPSKETVFKLADKYNLSAERAEEGRERSVEGNLCIVLGCIAEKLAGPNSQAILIKNILDYLVTYLKISSDQYVVLYALIALEKFAETTENKLAIKSRLEGEGENPLLKLELNANDLDYGWRQVGFCAQWSLDNLFIVEGRPLSYETVDMTGKNVILNTNDVSQYLKISPDGLEARSDSYSFESVRCTYQVDEGCWYYESHVVTSGVMQIGWATRNSSFLNHEGLGIGDDIYSISFDGCRKLIWHDAVPQIQEMTRWKPGDIVGCLLDLDRLEVIFSINGNSFKPCKKIFTTATKGFFAAASFMSFQQCRFNFGSEPFVYPPIDREFKNFNQHGVLTENEKILPRHISNKKLLNATVREDSCSICCDRLASCVLEPCGHSGFCTYCTMLLKECPLCRAKILNVEELTLPEIDDQTDQKEESIKRSESNHRTEPDIDDTT